MDRGTLSLSFTGWKVWSHAVRIKKPNKNRLIFNMDIFSIIPFSCQTCQLVTLVKHFRIHLKSSFLFIWVRFYCRSKFDPPSFFSPQSDPFGAENRRWIRWASQIFCVNLRLTQRYSARKGTGVIQDCNLLLISLIVLESCDLIHFKFCFKIVRSFISPKISWWEIRVRGDINCHPSFLSSTQLYKIKHSLLWNYHWS